MPGQPQRVVGVSGELTARGPLSEDNDADCPTFVPLYRPGISALHAIAASLATLLSACAAPPPADDADAVADFKATNDPLEPTNRVFYAINNGIDTAILRPAAKACRFVVPEPVRNGVHPACF